jgi:DNA-binding transcriptional ArsR family regulator
VSQLRRAGAPIDVAASGRIHGLHYAGKYLHNDVVDVDADKVFKALADPTRRYVLDQLRRNNGQTLGELCRHLDMARQSATQHIDILQRANLVTTLRRGRERLHYLNPIPIQEIQERAFKR